MTYKPKTSLKFNADLSIKPTLTDYFKCMLILFSIFTLIYIGIQTIQLMHRLYA